MEREERRGMQIQKILVAADLERKVLLALTQAVNHQKMKILRIKEEVVKDIRGARVVKAIPVEATETKGIIRIHRKIKVKILE